MIASSYSAIGELERKRKSQPPRPPRDPQVAVTGLLLGGIGELLAKLSRRGLPLPESVPGYGALPPGDVVQIHHFTPVPGLEVIDPSTWGSRSGLHGRKNAEASWVRGAPDVRPSMAYLPDYGYTNERIFGPNPTRIEGGLPGMYNLDADPDGLIEAARAKVVAEHGGASSPVLPSALPQAIAREVQQRGYTGFYRPNGPHGGEAMMFDIIDSRAPGNYPNIAQLRQDLGLPIEPGKGLFPIDDADIAAVTTESQPGKSLAPHRYQNYNDEGAAWLLHRDYERLLRNPDTTSVVAGYFKTPAPVYQGQGYYKGQRNPVSGARVVHDDATRPLKPEEIERMNAVAVVEGLLRDQDAAAWSRPYDLKIEPAKDDFAVLLESPTYGLSGLRSVADKIEKIPLGKYRQNPNDPTETMADSFVIVPNPNGGPGVLVFNVNSKVAPAEFQNMMRGVLAQETKRLGYDNVEAPTAKWGKADSGYFDNSEYESLINSLSPDRQMEARAALRDLTPAVDKIKAYHDSLRRPSSVPERTLGGGQP